MRLYIEQDALDVADKVPFETSPQEMVDYLIDNGYAVVEEPKGRTCTICGGYARYVVRWLLPNARTNPASSGYQGDDISYCSDRTTNRCEEHKEHRHHPERGFEWCSTQDMEWKRDTKDTI